MDEDDNIFLRAAMSKTVVEVPHSPEPSENKYMGPSTSGKKNVSIPKVQSTPVEKMLLGEGMQKYSRDFKAIVAFMSRHHEVLGEELGEYYRKASEDGMGGSTTNRKAAIERVRKLSQKTLDKTR